MAKERLGRGQADAIATAATRKEYPVAFKRTDTTDDPELRRALLKGTCTCDSCRGFREWLKREYPDD